MSILRKLIKWYRSPENEEPLYKCIDCDETSTAATSHIVCPACGGKLERIELAHEA
ncbi:hypothetical protein DMJ13_18965 [halophilic archaeon]|nr:hypothetical protein DMJ13_18965 [halophilic archaeon]